MRAFGWLFVVGVFVMMAAPAHAAESIKSYSGASPFTVDEYSRTGSVVTLSFSALEGADASAEVRCGSPAGKWGPVNVSGYCYKKNFCFDAPTSAVDNIIATTLAGKTITSRHVVGGTEGKVTNICYDMSRLAQASDVSAVPYSQCSGSKVKKLKSVDGSDVKRHCVWNYSGPDDTIVGVTGDPSQDDDMFRIKPSASAYLEYLDRSADLDPARLRWVERGSGGDSVMLPSGPHAGASAYKDFDTFMQRAPGNVSVEDACYAANMTLCAGITVPPGKPPVPGLCGSADGDSFLAIGDIPASGRCYIGEPSAITQSGETFVWSCSGIPSSEPADSCRANKITPVNGSCGGTAGTCAAGVANSDNNVTACGQTRTWGCAGQHGGTSTSCSKGNDACPINGTCGSAAGKSFSSAPSSNLCDNGTPTGVSGAGPWTWTCTGANGGTDSGTCTANKQTEACIPQGQTASAGQTQCPTNSCFFWVSGIAPSTVDDMGSSRTRIGSTAVKWVTDAGPAGADIVGMGDYPDTYGTDLKPGPFYHAANGTFDGMALGANTRLIVYKDKNFQGGEIFNRKGPLVMMSRFIGESLYTNFQTEDWSGAGALFQQFPPSTRELTPTKATMWTWSYSPLISSFGGGGYDDIDPNGTSIKVICE